MFYKNEVIVSELNESELIDKIIGYLERNPELGYINVENKTFIIYYRLDFGRYYGELGLDVKGVIETIDNTASIYLKYGEFEQGGDWFIIFALVAQFFLYLYLEFTGVRFDIDTGKTININFVLLLGILYLISIMYYGFSKQYIYLKILVKNLSSNNQCNT